MNKVYPVLFIVNQTRNFAFGLQTPELYTDRKLNNFLEELEKIKLSPGEEVIARILELANN